jgi:hypothetical protein
MDAAQLSEIFAVVAVSVGLGRYVFGSLDRAEQGFASLFVPPDHRLGWPRGVQESDEPWGWHPPIRPELPVIDADNPGNDDGVRETGIWLDPPKGQFVVPLRPVAPVRFRPRPH